MAASDQPAVAVLVLPGGKPTSMRESRPWQLANVRMYFVSAALRRRLGREVVVEQVRYRRRGWNAPGLDALGDAGAALRTLRSRFPHVPIVLVGHSMGGRVAVHLTHRDPVASVVALAPWWPNSDADLVSPDCRLVVAHGTADTWTDPDESRRQVERARLRGVAAQWIPVDDGHFMLRRYRRWHALAADAVANRLDEIR